MFRGRGGVAVPTSLAIGGQSNPTNLTECGIVPKVKTAVLYESLLGIEIN